MQSALINHFQKMKRQQKQAKTNEDLQNKQDSGTGTRMAKMQAYYVALPRYK